MRRWIKELGVWSESYAYNQLSIFKEPFDPELMKRPDAPAEPDAPAPTD